VKTTSARPLKPGSFTNYSTTILLATYVWGDFTVAKLLRNVYGRVGVDLVY